MQTRLMLEKVNSSTNKTMKNLFLPITLALISVPCTAPVSVQAQQVNVYQGCISEIYYPAHYDRYGNFVQSSVSRTFAPCSGGSSYERNCNPQAGALLGLGIAGAIAGGEKYSYNNSYGSAYSRNGYSSSSSSIYRNNNYWKSLGAGAGALLFGC